MIGLVADYLKGLGYTQTSVDDRVLAYLKDNTGTDGQVNDLLNNYLTCEGYTGSIQDKFHSWLKTLAGEKGQLNDLARKVSTGFPSDNLLCHMPLRSNLDLVVGTGVATFGRSSTATYVDPNSGLVSYAAIDEPRFEESGLLIENSTTNLLKHSSALSEAAWSKNNSSIVDDTALAPDGTMTADKLIENTANSEHFVNQNAQVVTGEYFTASVYLKAAERYTVTVSLGSSFFSSSALIRVNVSTGEVYYVGGDLYGHTVKPMPNGWFRVSVTGLATNTGNPSQVPKIRLLNENEDTSYLGDGVSGIYVWGAQSEQLKFPSSYIPTGGATKTRDSDNLEIDTSNIPLPTEDYSVSCETNILGLLVGSSEEQPAFRMFGESRRFMSVCRFGTTDAGIRHGTTAHGSGVNSVPFSNEKFVMTKTATELLMFKDGVELINKVPDTVTGTASDLLIGSTAATAGSGERLYGHIKNFRIYDKALSDSEVHFS